MWTSIIVTFLSIFGVSEPEILAVSEAPVVETHVTTAARVTRKARNAHKASKKSAAVRAPKAAVRAPKAAVRAPKPVPALEIVAPAPAVPELSMRVAVAPTASELAAKVQNFYNSTKSFKATFHQTVTNQTFNKLKPKKSVGRVYIKKPGMMRWDYKNPTGKAPKVSKSFISDGKHLWAVMAKNKQYYKENLGGSTLPVAVSFLMGTGDLRTDFDVALETPGKYGSKSDLLLRLTPKTPSARYKKLWLVIDSANFSVKQSVVLNSKGDTNSIRFSGVTIDDPSLKKGHFIFNEKANKDFRLVKPPEQKRRP